MGPEVFPWKQEEAAGLILKPMNQGDALGCSVVEPKTSFAEEQRPGAEPGWLSGCCPLGHRKGGDQTFLSLPGSRSPRSEWSMFAVAGRPILKDSSLHFYWAFNASAPGLT